MAMNREGGMKKNWLAIIHVAAAKLGLTDEEYRTLLQQRYGVYSAKNLSPEQGKDLMGYFTSHGFIQPGRNAVCKRCVPRPKRESIQAGVVYPVSPGQSAKINQLVKDIRWRTADGFLRWLMRYFKIRKIQTSVEASAVIYGLMRLWRNQNKCRCSLIKEVRTNGKRTFDKR